MHQLPRRLLLLPLLLLLAPASACADFVRITEVVTDPQSDHGESSGGNGIVFDSVPGTGSVGSTDEYVELFNHSGTLLDLTGWVLWFRDTTPSSYTFGTSTSGSLRFSEGGSITSFAAGEFLVLGNPPGALNNRIDIDLRNDVDDLIDTWSIPDGNATGLLDEAVARPLRGSGPIRAAATPGADTAAPVPEPGTLALFGVSAAGWWLSRRRRARRASARTRLESPLPPTCRPAVGRGTPACPDRPGAVEAHA
ncbi:MAG: lamin tail domain-containing protein [Planctomycetota bacterium]